MFCTRNLIPQGQIILDTPNSLQQPSIMHANWKHIHTNKNDNFAAHIKTFAAHLRSRLKIKQDIPTILCHIKYSLVWVKYQFNVCSLVTFLQVEGFIKQKGKYLRCNKTMAINFVPIRQNKKNWRDKIFV